MVVFTDAGVMQMERTRQAVERLGSLVSERYGRQVHFRTRLKDPREAEKRYVTREELSSVINMPIEEE